MHIFVVYSSFRGFQDEVRVTDLPIKVAEEKWLQFKERFSPNID